MIEFYIVAFMFVNFIITFVCILLLANEVFKED